MTFQYGFEHFAVSVSAISGALAARGKKVDLFGVIVLALVTAFGGGTVRDLMLGDFPVVWVRDTAYLWNALAMALATFFLVRYLEPPYTALLVADAFALALFTIIGVRRALSFHVASSAAVAMGVITGVAGGMIRDLLTGEIPLVFRPAIYLYATAAVCGAVVFLLLISWGLDAQTGMVLAVSLTLLLRLAAIRWKLRLPMFKLRRTAPAGEPPKVSPSRRETTTAGRS